jgi:hypothetical protein
MGRGLSSLQQRMLDYADRGRLQQGCLWNSVPWLDEHRSMPVNRPDLDLDQSIIPGKPASEWTPAQRAVVSRALARLEQRGLITRVKDGRRTRSVYITDEGEAYRERLGCPRTRHREWA